MFFIYLFFLQLKDLERRRSKPDEGFDDGDEDFDVPGGMDHVETLQVLPQPTNT